MCVKYTLYKHRNSIQVETCRIKSK